MDKTVIQNPRRVRREKGTLRIMLKLYCHARHGGDVALCPDCQVLLAYAEDRIDNCPFLPKKPTCAKCPVHCYTPVRRAQMREVMRYAGPRMLTRHPILALLHRLDEIWIEPPVLPHRRQPTRVGNGEKPLKNK